METVSKPYEARPYENRMVDRKVQGGYVGPYGNRMADRMEDRMVSLRKGGPYEDRMVDRMETVSWLHGFHTVSVPPCLAHSKACAAPDSRCNPCGRTLRPAFHSPV